MIDFLRKLFGKKTQPLNKIYINPRAFLHNFEYLQSLHPTNTLFPVIKSNAYGHGLKEIAKILRDVPTTYLCVDSYPEYAIASRYNKHNFLVLSETNAENYKLYNWNRTAFAVSSFNGLEYFIKKRKTVRIHLFINTGLHREGFDIQDIPEVITKLRDASHIILEGVMSHLAQADAEMINKEKTEGTAEETTEGISEVTNEGTATKTDQQIRRFKEIHTLLTDAGFSPRFRHIGASAGLLTIQDPFFTAWRPGLALYGYCPLIDSHPEKEKSNNLAIVARVTSTIITNRLVPKGETIGYGGKRKAPEDTHIGLIPFGYYEGLPRLLSNAWYIKHGDDFLPVLGTISMNYHMIGLTPSQEDYAENRTVEIFGSTPQAQNSLVTAAKTAQTNVYELLVKLNEKIKRIIQDSPLP